MLSLQALYVGSTFKFSFEQRHDVISTTFQGCSNVRCPLGCFHLDDFEIYMFCCALQEVVRGCTSPLLLNVTQRYLEIIRIDRMPIYTVSNHMYWSTNSIKPICKKVDVYVTYV